MKDTHTIRDILDKTFCTYGGAVKTVVTLDIQEEIKRELMESGVPERDIEESFSRLRKQFRERVEQEKQDETTAQNT